MNIRLVPVKISDRDVLREMLYEYEKEIVGEKAEEYKYLDAYFEKPNRFPYFIKVDGEIAGFVLINKHLLILEDGTNLSEFYVKKEFRKNRIGMEASKMAYQLFPGKWEVRQILENPIAHSFWLKSISEFTNNNFTEEFIDNDKWHGWIQVFNMNGNKF